MAVTINGDTGVTTPGISNSEGYTGDGLTIAAGAPSGAVQVDTSGNVGLGVTPSAWSVGKAFEVGTVGNGIWGVNSTSVYFTQNAYYNGGWKYANSTTATNYQQNGGQHIWQTAPSGTAGNAISFTQAMTLDASGSLLVGTTSNPGGGFSQFVVSGPDTVAINNTAAGTGTATSVYFKRNATGTGTITVTGSATAYNTSSDYRLKENIQPMTGALAKVAALKPVTYKWKVDGSDGEGFIAHELAEVCPQAVSGEKDAVEVVDVKDEDGNVIGTEERPVYQGIDTSFLVATLTAAIQELKEQVDAQAVEIAALKGQA